MNVKTLLSLQIQVNIIAENCIRKDQNHPNPKTHAFLFTFSTSYIT